MMRDRRFMHVQLAAAAALLASIDRGEVEIRQVDVEPERPRIPDLGRYLAEASAGTETRGPKPRRKWPVRR